MKYLEIPELARLALALNHEGPECSVHTRIEAYSCKNIKRDKRLFRSLESAYADDVSHSPPAPSFVGMDKDADMTPFGPFDKHSSRKTLYLLIALLNAAFPDHEFSDVRPAHFNREQSGAAVLGALSTTLVSPHRAGLRAPRTYSSYPPTTSDLFPSSLPTSSSPPAPLRSPHAPPEIVTATHPTLYRILDDVIGLQESEVFSFEPDIASDPHAHEFSDDEDEVASLPGSDSDESPPEDTFAFDDYDIDEDPRSRARTRTRSGSGPYPVPGSRIDIDDDELSPTAARRRGALLWSSHWFFLNRKLKRILFISVWARAKRPGLWADDDEGYGSAERMPSISGERFLGWEGAVGAGARAMGLSATV